ncbi:MAG: PepSY domain-containing protein [Candidatus Accumulibacter sp.]|jgi:uncharacterized iron-regulated membrane protein|nr:PepSY domain-containing protein [Accumulibacter sp.]
MTPKTLKAWQFVHTWSSLVCMVFLLVLCVTGLPLIFGGEIYSALGAAEAPPQASAHVPAHAPFLAVDTHLAAVRALYPGHEITSVTLWREKPFAQVFLRHAREVPEAPQEKEAIFDRCTGERLGQDGQATPPSPGQRFGLAVMHVMVRLHLDAYAGIAGMLFYAFMTLLFILSTISGVVLYGPFMRKLDFGTVRRERSRRLKWLDVHNLLGIVTLVWVLMIAVTGIFIDIAPPLDALWKRDYIEPVQQKYADELPLGPDWPVSLQAAIDAAQQRLPDFRVTYISLPGAFTPVHFKLTGHGTTPFSKNMENQMLVDARTGEVTDIIEIPWYIRMLQWAFPHFGGYAGMPMKILWAILDVLAIIILASGLYLWLARRKSGTAPASPACSNAPAEAIAKS